MSKTVKHTNNSHSRFRSKLVYILSDTPDYVRASKCIPLFTEMFREVHFVGCSRGKVWDPERSKPGVHYHVDGRTLAHGASSILGALGFLRYVRNKLLEIQPDVVVATNEEYILPFSCGYFPRPNHLICDLTDSLAIRMMGPLRHLGPLWSFLSLLAKMSMTGMVEVTEERLARHSYKPAHSTVVYNSPNWCEVDPIDEIPNSSIYVCGSTLDTVSGVETLLAAVEKIPNLNIVFAGRMVGNWLNTCFIQHPRVINLGETTPSKSLQIASSCLALFAHYKPFIPNYIFAAPNKLFDAMMLGVPLLINSECKASEMATRYGFGIATPFGDVIALQRSLENLMKHNAVSLENRVHCKNIFRDKYSWELMESRWVNFFKKMGVT